MSSLQANEEPIETVNQLSFTKFDATVTANELTAFLEAKVGIIRRCRVKSSWTPPDTYPIFHVAAGTSGVSWKENYDRVAPHAFVHFCSEEAVEEIMDAQSKGELVLKGSSLRVRRPTDHFFRVNKKREANPFKFFFVCVGIGNKISEDIFSISWGGTVAAHFVIDPLDDSCKIFFKNDTVFLFKGTRDMAKIKCDFKLEFFARDITELNYSKDGTKYVLRFQLASAPSVYYRTAADGDDIYFKTIENLLDDDDDPWIRTTDFTPSRAMGRCNTYTILLSQGDGRKIHNSREYLRDRGVNVRSPDQRIMGQFEPDYRAYTSEPLFCLHDKEGINFSTMFLVNALMHKGVVNKHQLSDEFFSLLRCQSDAVNETALMHIFSYKRPIYDAPGRLKLVQDWLKKDPQLLRPSESSDDTLAVRRLVITPTKAYCLPPEVELSNRILRNYMEYADRFLRVTFMDEGMQQLNSHVFTCYMAPILNHTTSNLAPRKTSVFWRVKDILNYGFRLCGRNYSFLAYSTSQLSDRSAWFFAEDPGTITVETIRNWMGKFSTKNVARYAARMGLCFSSTYATVNVPPNEVNPSLEDIKRNGYIFSDGIGKITSDLAQKVVDKLHLMGETPSAYQIRYAGCKGVVAVWPGNGDEVKLSLRQSMHKFESDHTVLEVVSWTRFLPGFLNRQIITLLSTLKVPDDVFDRMQDSMILKLNKMLEDTNIAYDVLTTSCAEQGNIAAMMLSAGFKPQSEPYLKAMLSCIRSSQLGDLLAKTRIFVSKGRSLMGCFDELGVLKQGQCFIQASNPSLENCFLKHGSRFSAAQKNKQVIVGNVAIAKNPCLHPGDIRILEAVDAPDLHHLVDCLIFPQKGERPHPNEASGSDLDGDLYFVTWDENLLPPDKKSSTPMDYTPAEEKELERPVLPQDIVEFYSNNMVNDQLGVISQAHVVQADLSTSGAKDKNCLKLAELAAIAVDFPKTGALEHMPPSLKPQKYPDFMDKDKSMSYTSQKILGRLYRKIKDVTDKSLQTNPACTLKELPYDKDLEITVPLEDLTDAWERKVLYDRRLNALLDQYAVRSEEEVVTGHIWSMPKFNSKKQGELKERLRNAYSALYKEFRHNFETLGPSFSQLTDDEKCKLYEQKASAWYQVTYCPQWVKKSSECKGPGEDGEDDVPARLSFAWIAADFLVPIKIRSRKVKPNSEKPINSLATYLYERIATDV